MLRRLRCSSAAPVVALLGLAVLVSLVPAAAAGPEEAGTGRRATVSARLTGWVGRSDGFHLYRPGATARLVVNVWPDLTGEQVRGRLEWRRAGTPWRLVDVSASQLNRDSRAVFLVRHLPLGSAFRMRARVPPGAGHGAGRSAWRYFRAR